MTSTPLADTENTAPAGDIYGGKLNGRMRRKTVRMREDAWRELCAEKGIKSDTVLGSMLSYNPSHLFRVRFGKSTPGAELIATSLHVFGKRFEDLWEIVDRDETEQQAS